MLEFWCSDFPIFPVLFRTPQTERWETSTLLSWSISESNACRKAWFSHVFFFLTFLVSSTPTSLLWTPEAWFKTCQAISDSYYMLFNVSNPWNFQCLQAAAAKLSSLFRRSSGRQCSLTRQDISLSHIFPGAIRLFMVDLVHCIPWPKAFLEVCRTRLESVLTLTIFCRQWVCCILFTFINILSSFKLTCLLFRQGLKGTNWLQ